MTIEMTGIRFDSELRVRVIAELGAILDRERTAAMSVLVAFFDDDGPKHGPAIRCALTVRRPHGRTIHVEHSGRSRGAAFDAAFATLARHMREDAERARDLRRRPKKYFAARRLQDALEARP